MSETDELVAALQGQLESYERLNIALKGQLAAYERLHAAIQEQNNLLRRGQAADEGTITAQRKHIEILEARLFPKEKNGK